MSKTLIPFNPSPFSAPPFSATVVLDSKSYTLSCVWSFYRNDWYMQLSDSSGSMVLFQPLISSPDGFDITLAPGMFQTSTLVFRQSTQNFEQSP